MGERGPIAKPGGIRGRRAAKQAKKRPAAGKAKLTCPAWLDADAVPHFAATVRELQNSGVPLASIDSAAVGAYCSTLAAAAKAARDGDARLAARLNRDLQTWSNLIGANPGARARMNLKAKIELQDDVWAQFDR